MRRRRFLQMAAGGGAGVVAGCSSGTPSPHGTVPGAAGATSVAQTGTSSAVSNSTGQVPWSSLARGLSGTLVLPADTAYGTARLAFNPRFDGIRPAAIAQCHSPADVRECLAFAARYRVPVAPRSGGHSYVGASSTSGLLIDVAAMNGVAADGGGTATIGAGAKLIDVYAGLAASGVSVPGGSCPTVGIAGLTLGGGVGVTGRKYGLTSDNLVAAQVVVPDGRVLTCDASSESDLFWACRGGGGGNFGIVTSFTFRTHTIGDIVLFYLRWPWARAADVVRAWQRWAPSAPDELWSNCHLLANPSGSGPAVTVGGTYVGDQATAEQHIAQLVAAVGTDPSGRSVETTTYAHAMGVEAGCASRTTAECHLPWQNPAGQLSREAEFAASDFFTTPLSDAAISVITAAVERRRGLGGGGDGGVAFDAFGGALNRVAPDATAFVHRNTLFLAQYTTTWATGTPSSITSAHTAWLTAFHNAMRPYASGQAYQNYADANLTGWQQAYYGANYARLTRVKATYDPGFLLRPPQAIGTS